MTASSPSSSVPEYRLEVGDAVFALRCPQPGLAEGLSAWFDRPSVPMGAGEPAITLEVTVIPHDDQPSFPRSLLTTKRLLGDGAFDISDGLITGRFDPSTGCGEVRVKAALLTGRLTRIFEQVLYQAHSSARARMGRPAWLVHSSSVIVDGQGFLFVGPSGSGKSTVVANSVGRHVLGDEMSLVRPLAGGAGGWELVGTPFNGTFRTKRPGCAPLRAVLLLEHGPVHELGDTTESAAVAVLAGEIVPPVGLDEVPGPDTLPRMVDAAQAIAANTTLKVMRFTPDPGFWKILESTFGLPPLS